LSPKRLPDYAAAYRRDTLVNPIIIFVSNFDKCLRFYRKVFQLGLLHKSADWAELDAGGFILSIHGGYKGSPNRHQRPIALHFVCRDIDKTIPLVRKYGGSVGRLRTLDFRPDELVTAKEDRFHDPDGNEFELRQIISIC
jgi:predicted enzyme related to lactoylglutathione lyase